MQAIEIACAIVCTATQVGTPNEVYRHPQCRLVADFIGETNFITGTAEDDGTISTRAGHFHGTISKLDWKPGKGEPVLLSIRPECWTLRRENHAPNCVAGRIRKATYLGEVAQYEFETCGERLKIFELNPRFVDAGRDQTFFAAAEKEDVIILPA